MEKTREYVPMKVIKDVLDRTNKFELINSFYVTLKGFEVSFVLHSKKDIDLEELGHIHDYYLSLNKPMNLLKAGEMSKEDFTKYVYTEINDFIDEKRHSFKRESLNSETFKDFLEENIEKDYHSLKEYLIDTLSDAYKIVEQIANKKFFSFMMVNTDTDDVALISIMYQGKGEFSYLELHGKNKTRKSGLLSDVECANYIYEYRNFIKKRMFILE